MGLMIERKKKLLMQKAGIPYELFSFEMDGAIHNTDILVPARDFAILVEVGAIPTGASTGSYVDTTVYANNATTGRQFGVAFYSNYAYVDLGGKRSSKTITEGYDGTVVNRFAVTIDENNSYISYLTTKRSTGTAVSTVGLNDIGYLRGNNDKNKKGNSVTAWLYRKTLSDAKFLEFITNGTLPK